MSVASLWSYAVVGVEAVPVRVEAHARSGLPGVSIVGLPGAAVREARERIRSAAASSRLPLPTRRITVNLSPGDVPKDSPGFDLPVALATLAACGYLCADRISAVAAVGELSLEGTVRLTRGLLSVSESASRQRLRLLIVPVEGLSIASEVSDIPIAGVRSLAEVVELLINGDRFTKIMRRGELWLRRGATEPVNSTVVSPDLAEVCGHQQAKRALEIVAAGGHHLLMVGSPGSGKTMLARRLVGILPSLARDEAIDVTRVWSVAGLQDAHGGLIRERPFRSPHHTASRVALVGGSSGPRPGEVSLAHRGVLFLDELPEFSRDSLEALRQPLEEGRVVIARRTGSVVFPAACTLVAAMNPCRCGYLGHAHRPCQCSPSSLQSYRSRISGPLLDRVDALIEVPPLTVAELDGANRGENSKRVGERVCAAREFAKERKSRQGRVVGGGSLEEQVSLGEQPRRLLRQALVDHRLSGRGYARVMRLARTIADLDGSEMVLMDHAAEALGLRLDQHRVGPVA